MTDPKTPDDLLNAYTDDLLADRRPRLHEDMASLAEADRADVPHLASLVRRLKAAHTEPPPPTEVFLARLDSTVATEIAARGTRHAAPAHPERGFLAAAKEYLFGWRWQLAGCAVAAVLLIFQVQTFVRLQELRQENRDLLGRLDRLAAPERMAPLSLPVTPPVGALPPIEPNLKKRVEEKIKELEVEREAKSGVERQSVDRAIQELQTLLQGAQRK